MRNVWLPQYSTCVARIPIYHASKECNFILEDFTKTIDISLNNLRLVNTNEALARKMETYIWFIERKDELTNKNYYVRKMTYDYKHSYDILKGRISNQSRDDQPKFFGVKNLHDPTKIAEWFSGYIYKASDEVLGINGLCKRSNGNFAQLLLLPPSASVADPNICLSTRAIQTVEG